MHYLHVKAQAGLLQVSALVVNHTQLKTRSLRMSVVPPSGFANMQHGLHLWSKGQSHTPFVVL